ncbi:MAG TPA: hypothetical protein VFB84_11180 [Micromonosporaceae bacterium]|nr:hypothetical protein [Micromonosporaceae bacterium]
MVKSMPVTAEWRFARGDATAYEIQSVVDDLFAYLREPSSDQARAARRAGVEPAALAGATVRVREGEHGAEPLLTTILVGIAVSASSRVIESLWADVVWPYLRRRLGAAALGGRVGDQDASGG